MQAGLRWLRPSRTPRVWCPAWWFPNPLWNCPRTPGVTVRRGATTVATVGKNLVDFTTYANLYQSCAALAASINTGPYAAAYAAGFAGAAFPVAPNRCASLKAQGLLTTNTTAEQAEESLQKLAAYGWEPESAALHPSHIAFRSGTSCGRDFCQQLVACQRQGQPVWLQLRSHCSHGCRHDAACSLVGRHVCRRQRRATVDRCQPGQQQRQVWCGT
jgi:hypothetical protein